MRLYVVTPIRPGLCRDNGRCNCESFAAVWPGLGTGLLGAALWGAWTYLPTPKTYEYTLRLVDGSVSRFRETLPTTWQLGERMMLIEGTSQQENP